MRVYFNDERTLSNRKVAPPKLSPQAQEDTNLLWLPSRGVALNFCAILSFALPEISTGSFAPGAFVWATVYFEV